MRRWRRLRTGAAIRGLVRETRVSREQLVQPLFVVEGRGVKRGIASLPGQYHFSVDCLIGEIGELIDAGIGSVLLFGVPDVKDEQGTGAYADGNIVSRAIQAVKKHYPALYVIADVCLCEYTSHGHCGIVLDGVVDNDKTLPLIAQTAASYARAGVDMVAPSCMMDGSVAAIRAELDGLGFPYVPIMSYSAKYSSAFYGPFREAANSAPQFGDRRGYQMDPSNRHEALREIRADIEQGADIVMVKPALTCLDILRDARELTDVPIAAYSVSGEYAMIKAAAANGWLDEAHAAQELLTSISRAGADIIITYFAKQISGVLYQ